MFAQTLQAVRQSNLFETGSSLISNVAESSAVRSIVDAASPIFNSLAKIFSSIYQSGMGLAGKSIEVIQALPAELQIALGGLAIATSIGVAIYFNMGASTPTEVEKCAAAVAKAELGLKAVQTKLEAANTNVTEKTKAKAEAKDITAAKELAAAAKTLVADAKKTLAEAKNAHAKAETDAIAAKAKAEADAAVAAKAKTAAAAPAK